MGAVFLRSAVEFRRGDSRIARRPCWGGKTLRRPPMSIRKTVSQLPRHCEAGKARRGNPVVYGTPRKVDGIATACGLAMTCVFWLVPLFWHGGRGNRTGDSGIAPTIMRKRSRESVGNAVPGVPAGDSGIAPTKYRRRMQKNRSHHWERFYVAFSITGTA